jgi:hypothetical protein
MPAKPEPKPQQKVCFIVGPIGEDNSPVRLLADWMLHGVIKPVLEAEEFGYLVKRADHEAEPGSIASAVINELTSADLVVADLTGFNPNAFYELGIRHTLRLPVIHMIAESVKLPFDNADQRTIFVDFADFHKTEKAKVSLASAVRAINADGYELTNPVIQAVGLKELRASSDPKDRVIASLEERLARLEQERREGLDGKDTSFYYQKALDLIYPSASSKDLLSHDPATRARLVNIVNHKGNLPLSVTALAKAIEDADNTKTRPHTSVISKAIDDAARKARKDIGEPE